MHTALERHKISAMTISMLDLLEQCQSHSDLNNIVYRGQACHQNNSKFDKENSKLDN